MMTDKPMIFSAPMIRALLDGRKTQTRRIWKPQPEYLGEYGGYEDLSEWGWLDQDGSFLPAEDIKPNGLWIGDRLWVRESWALQPAVRRPKREDNLIYRADAPDDEPPLRKIVTASRVRWMHYQMIKFKPSIHMPRWASRLTLIVTDVRVQRLQDISEEDAMAEGVEPILVPPDGGGAPHVEGFRDLWDSINAKRGYGWDKNPWVVAVNFNVHKCNIDDLPREGDG